MGIPIRIRPDKVEILSPGTEGACLTRNDEPTVGSQRNGIPNISVIPAVGPGPKGIPTIIFGPGSIEEAHTADEFVSVDEVVEAAQILFDYVTGNF